MNKEAELACTNLKEILVEAKASTRLSMGEIIQLIDDYAMKEIEEKAISNQNDEELGAFVKHLITKLNYEKEVEYHSFSVNDNTPITNFICDEYVFFDLEQELKPEGTRKLLIGDNVASAPIQMMLRIKRAYEGLSESHVADIVGCSTTELRNFEKGKKCLKEKYHGNLEKYLFNQKYTLDEEGNYTFYDHDWHN